MTTPHDPQAARNDAYTAMPKWVKWFLAAVVAVVAVVVAVLLVAGGDHGPGRHMSAPAGLLAVTDR